MTPGNLQRRQQQAETSHSGPSALEASCCSSSNRLHRHTQKAVHQHRPKAVTPLNPKPSNSQRISHHEDLNTAAVADQDTALHSLTQPCLTLKEQYGIAIHFIIYYAKLYMVLKIIIIILF